MNQVIFTLIVDVQDSECDQSKEEALNTHWVKEGMLMERVRMERKAAQDNAEIHV